MSGNAWMFSDQIDDEDMELMGDYYIPALEVPEEHRPIGRWGRDGWVKSQWAACLGSEDE